MNPAAGDFPNHLSQNLIHPTEPLNISPEKDKQKKQQAEDPTKIKTNLVANKIFPDIPSKEKPLSAKERLQQQLNLVKKRQEETRLQQQSIQAKSHKEQHSLQGNLEEIQIRQSGEQVDKTKVRDLEKNIHKEREIQKEVVSEKEIATETIEQQNQIYNEQNLDAALKIPDANQKLLNLFNVLTPVYKNTVKVLPDGQTRHVGQLLSEVHKNLKKREFSKETIDRLAEVRAILSHKRNFFNTTTRTLFIVEDQKHRFKLGDRIHGLEIETIKMQTEEEFDNVFEGLSQLLQELDEFIAYFNSNLGKEEEANESQEKGKMPEQISNLKELTQKTQIVNKVIDNLLTKVAQSIETISTYEKMQEWNKRMIEDFMKQIEKEYQIKLESIKQFIIEDNNLKDQIFKLRSNISTLKEPEKLSMFNLFVFDLYNYAGGKSPIS